MIMIYCENQMKMYREMMMSNMFYVDAHDDYDLYALRCLYICDLISKTSMYYTPELVDSCFHLCRHG
jgi:hypothetical protein